MENPNHFVYTVAKRLITADKNVLQGPLFSFINYFVLKLEVA